MTNCSECGTQPASPDNRYGFCNDCWQAKWIPNGPVYTLGVDVFLGERTVYRQFECARCEASYTTATTEADANREFLHSGQPASSGMSSVCDDCYDYLMTRARADGLLAEGTQP